MSKVEEFREAVNANEEWQEEEEENREENPAP